MKPRAPCTMLAHAFTLAWRQFDADRRDAQRMRVLMRLRLNPRARMLVLAGLAGGTNSTTDHR